MKRHILMFVAVSGLIFLGVQCLNLNNNMPPDTVSIVWSKATKFADNSSSSDANKAVVESSWNAYATILDMDHLEGKDPSDFIIASGATGGKNTAVEIVRVNKADGKLDTIAVLPYDRFAFPYDPPVFDGKFSLGSLSFNYPVAVLSHKKIVYGYSIKQGGSKWIAGIKQLESDTDGRFKDDGVFTPLTGITGDSSYVARFVKSEDGSRVYAIIVEWFFSEGLGSTEVDGTNFAYINGGFKFAIKVASYENGSFAVSNPIDLGRFKVGVSGSVSSGSTRKEWVTFPYIRSYLGKLYVICNYRDNDSSDGDKTGFNSWLMVIDPSVDFRSGVIVKEISKNFFISAVDFLVNTLFVGGYSNQPEPRFATIDLSGLVIDSRAQSQSRESKLLSTKTRGLIALDKSSGERAEMRVFRHEDDKTYHIGFKDLKSGDCFTVEGKDCSIAVNGFNFDMPVGYINRHLLDHQAIHFDASSRFLLVEGVLPKSEGVRDPSGNLVPSFKKLHVWKHPFNKLESRVADFNHNALLDVNLSNGRISTFYLSKSLIVDEESRTVFVGTSNRADSHLTGEGLKAPSWCEVIKLQF